MALSSSQKKIIRFIFAGSFVTLIYILSGLFLLTFFSISPVVANGFAFVIANLVSYIIHTLWSFSTKFKKNNFFKFYIVSFCGFLISLIFPAIGQSFNLDKSLAIIVTSITIPLFTFLLHHLWTYK